MRMGLVGRFNTLAIALVVGTTFVVSTFLLQTEMKARYRDLLTRGATAAATVARNSEYAAYTEHEESLRQIVDGVSLDPDVAYVVITKGSHRVLAQKTNHTEVVIPKVDVYEALTSHRDVEFATLGGKETEQLFDIRAVIPGVTEVSGSPELFPEEVEGESTQTANSTTDTKVYGYVRLGLSTAALRAELRALAAWTGLFALTMAALGMLVSVLMTRRITRPVLELVTASREIADGNLDRRVNVSGLAEVEVLARTFNMMMENLHQARDEVLSYQRTLEDKVALRTIDLKQARDDARALAEKADEANRAKSAFLRNMSHEIRTPMSGVIATADLLLHTKLDEEQAEYARTVSDSSHTLMKIINDILDLSKVESNQLTVEKIPFDVGATVEQVMHLYREPARLRGLEFDCDNKATHIGTVVGDPVRLGQVLSNLVNNAIKFTASGRVRLRILVLEDKTDTVSLRFAVADTGIGMDSDTAERIFEAFAQADVSTTRVYGGPGLGLTISRQLVELMGGTLEVQSQPAQGSSFSFTLRLKKTAQAPVGSSFTQSPAIISARDQQTSQIHSAEQRRQFEIDADEQTSQNPRILLAEDDPSLRHISRIMLERLGYTVDTANDGAAAVQATAANRYKLVLMDCQMPVLNGYDATRKIRERELQSGGHLTIIALTAAAMDGTEQECMDAGMDAYLTKPITLGMLRKTLKDVTGE